MEYYDYDRLVLCYKTTWANVWYAHWTHLIAAVPVQIRHYHCITFKQMRQGYQLWNGTKLPLKHEVTLKALVS